MQQRESMEVARFLKGPAVLMQNSARQLVSFDHASSKNLEPKCRARERCLQDSPS
mgnify:CR=1 FL=1